MRPLAALADIFDQYDVFFLDLWGVVHDGTALYDGVHHTLSELRVAGKTVLFISNAPRRAVSVSTRLGELGIEAALYDHVVSSGEVGYRWLEAGNAAHLGNRYFFIGPQRDAGVLDGLPQQLSPTLEGADYLLNVGFGSEEQTSDDFAPLLAEAAARKLPMLCLNPDLEVVKITGERFPCAGVLAHEYVRLGGHVEWFGKPYPAIYDFAHALVGTADKRRILAVGDSLETDIPGAKQFGVDSLLITGGILKDKSVAEIEAECAALALSPTYYMKHFTTR
jgi:HAD superfamily hydrolase (TIGR01459 family)